jgi:23S rRNA (uracil1939-C5)-methyltransferase
MTPESACQENCPGCRHRWMTQEQSLGQKQNWLIKTLSDWPDRLETICSVEAPLRWKYRSKVCLSARWDTDGWEIGLRRGDEIVDLHQCPVHVERVEKSLNIFIKHLPPHGEFPLVFYAQSGAQITLVVKQKSMPDLSWLDADLISRLESAGIEGLWMHLNPGAGKNVFAKNTWQLLWGVPRSKDCNEMTYGPKSFQQLIPFLYRQSLDQAENFLSPEPEDLMIDLYCGGGAGLSLWTVNASRVIGVDLNGEAVECAKINAPSATVLRGKCSQRIPQLIEWASAMSTPRSRRLIYVNPPRTGMEPQVIDWVITKYQPERMAYLSCSAGTLRRDLTLLEKSGYDIVRITPYDFFPQTHHVECLAYLRRRSAD